jgi:hypothetical protein
MNCKDIGNCCCIDENELKYYSEAGLLPAAGEYSEDDLHRVALIHSLLKAGLEREEVKRFLTEREEEQVRMLRKLRCRMICDMHEQQQEIDKIDYLIREIKNLKEE